MSAASRYDGGGPCDGAQRWRSGARGRFVRGVGALLPAAGLLLRGQFVRVEERPTPVSVVRSASLCCSDFHRNYRPTAHGERDD